MDREPPGMPRPQVVLPRRAAQVLHFEPGSLWQLGPATVSVVKPVAVGKLLIRYLSDAHTEIVSAAILRPLPNAADSAERQVPIEQHSRAVWTRAREEERLIAPLLERATPADRDGVAKAVALSNRQVRRKLKRYEALRSVEAFLPFRRGRLHGSTQIHPEVERLMDEEIRAVFKVTPDVGVDDLVPIIGAAAKALGLTGESAGGVAPPADSPACFSCANRTASSTCRKSFRRSTRPSRCASHQSVSGWP